MIPKYLKICTPAYIIQNNETTLPNAFNNNSPKAFGAVNFIKNMMIAIANTLK